MRAYRCQRFPQRENRRGRRVGERLVENESRGSAREPRRSRTFQSAAADETAGNSNKFPADSTLVKAIGWLQDEVRHPYVYIWGDNLRV